MPDGPTAAHRHEESHDSRRKDAPSLQIEAEAVIVWADESELAVALGLHGEVIEHVHRATTPAQCHGRPLGAELVALGVDE